MSKRTDHSGVLLFIIFVLLMILMVYEGHQAEQERDRVAPIWAVPPAKGKYG